MSLSKCPQCGWVHPYIPSKVRGPTPEVQAIIDDVCAVFSVPASEVLSDLRARHVAEVRQLIISLAKFKTRYRVGEIGQQLGRDHKTVIHSIATTEKRMRNDSKFADIVWRHYPDYARSLTKGAA